MTAARRALLALPCALAVACAPSVQPESADASHGGSPIPDGPTGGAAGAEGTPAGRSPDAASPAVGAADGPVGGPMDAPADAPSAAAGPVPLPLVVTDHFSNRGWFGDATIAAFFKPGSMII